MSGNEKKEFGDYQTPLDFCYKVCNYVKKQGYSNSIKAILEPTCGVGNFLYAAADIFKCDKIVGIEVNEEYANITKSKLPKSIIEKKSIFNINTKQICGVNNVLVIGNPPWVTSSDLEYNLPKKINFKGLKGMDAITGSSNFDICEYIILQLIEEYKNTDSLICMLCKTSVARNVVLEISRNRVPYSKIEMLNFNSNKIFGISAAACVLIIQLSADEKDIKEVVCEVKNFDDESVEDILIVSDSVLKSKKTKIDFEGKCQFTWRQGVKHDCSKIMELDCVDGNFVNKNKDLVEIEEGLVFPLVKSSHFKKPIIKEFSKFVIVTQRKQKQDTVYIQEEYPNTWKYLNENIENFNKRKSSIYKNSPQFSMFGIGEYSFAPYKVGLSGFYKKPLFSLLYSKKPVMTDDTAYFLAFNDYNIAYCMMLLLNSKKVQEYLMSIAFLDNKRPYTVKLLSRLDIKKCIDEVKFVEIKQAETDFKLDEYVTKEMYNNLLQLVINN